MAYVQRDANGKIIGSFANPQPGYAEEEIADDSPELIAFLIGNSPPSAARIALLQQLTDIDMQSIRPLRAINAGSEMDADVQKITTLDAQAVTLRALLAVTP